MKLAIFNVNVNGIAELAPRLKSAGVDAWVRGEEHASDHAPVWVTLRKMQGRRRA